MPLKYFPSKAWILGWIVAISTGCDSENNGNLQSKVAAAEAPKIVADAKTSVPGAPSADLGAASWIPEDAAYFRATLRLREEWQAITESRAFKKILVLPAVQMALGQLLQHPAYKGFLKESQNNPFLKSALEVASDAISREIFVYVGQPIVPLLKAVGNLHMAAIVKGVFSAAGDNRATQADPHVDFLRALATKMLTYEKALRFPPLVVGFRLTSPDAARSLLEKAIDLVKSDLPVPLVLEEAGGGKFHTLKLGYELLPTELRSEITTELSQSGLSEDEVAKLTTFLESQTLALSVGLRGEYLLLSIGANTEHLQKLGQGRSLASSNAFAPVRGGLKPNLVSLFYLDAELTGAGKAPVDDWMAALDELLGSEMAADLPKGLAPRLKKDAKSFLDDLNRSLPVAAPIVSMSFHNRGIETFSFAARGGSGLDSTRTLSILTRAGASPLVAIAARGAPSREAYDRFTSWVGVAYGYFEEFALPRVPSAELKEVKRFQLLFVPAIKELHEITASLLLPAIDGCQDLFVLDGGGLLPALPGETSPLPRPLKYPRPFLAVEVNDTEKLAQAFSRYRESLNRFFKVAERELKITPFQIPAPASSPHAGGTRYSYPLPARLGPGFEPHALLSGKLAVLALAPDQSKQVVEPASSKTSGQAADLIVDLALPAGMAYKIELAALSKLVLEGVGTIVIDQGKRRALPPQMVSMVLLHLPELEKSLGAFKSLTGRVYTDGPLEVHHSWLHVEDTADD